MREEWGSEWYNSCSSWMGSDRGYRAWRSVASRRRDRAVGRLLASHLIPPPSLPPHLCTEHSPRTLAFPPTSASCVETHGCALSTLLGLETPRPAHTSRRHSPLGPRPLLTLFWSARARQVRRDAPASSQLCSQGSDCQGRGSKREGGEQQPTAGARLRQRPDRLSGQRPACLYQVESSSGKA
jgi:hypothetical protein